MLKVRETLWPKTHTAVAFTTFVSRVRLYTFDLVLLLDYIFTFFFLISQVGDGLGWLSAFVLINARA